MTEVENLFASISVEKGEFAYPRGKWTIKELLGHLINCERVFSYRALKISRGDKTPLLGFDQDLLTDNGDFNLKEFPVSLLRGSPKITNFQNLLNN